MSDPKFLENHIHPEMIILDIVARWESTQAVFKRWDSLAGECICCNALFESLEQASQKYGLDLGKLLKELEEEAGRVDLP